MADYEMHRLFNSGQIDELKAYIRRENHYHLNTPDADGHTMLNSSVSFGEPEIVQCILDSGGNLNQSDLFGCTALDTAARAGNRKMVEFLLERGAGLNPKIKMRYSDGRPPDMSLGALYWAARGGHHEIMQLLIDRGADINEYGRYIRHTRPIHGAAENGSPEVARLLIDRGADINCQDHVTRSPLFIATENKHRDMVSFLIKKGADVNQKTCRGITPFDLVFGRLKAEKSGDDLALLIDLSKRGGRPGWCSFRKSGDTYHPTST